MTSVDPRPHRQTEPHRCGHDDRDRDQPDPPPTAGARSAGDPGDGPRPRSPARERRTARPRWSRVRHPPETRGHRVPCPSPTPAAGKLAVHHECVHLAITHPDDHRSRPGRPEVLPLEPRGGEVRTLSSIRPRGRNTAVEWTPSVRASLRAGGGRRPDARGLDGFGGTSPRGAGMQRSAVAARHVQADQAPDHRHWSSGGSGRSPRRGHNPDGGRRHMDRGGGSVTARPGVGAQHVLGTVRTAGARTFADIGGH